MTDFGKVILAGTYLKRMYSHTGHNKPRHPCRGEENIQYNLMHCHLHNFDCISMKPVFLYRENIIKIGALKQLQERKKHFTSTPLQLA